MNGPRHPALGSLLGLMHQMSTVEVARLSLWDTGPWGAVLGGTRALALPQHPDQHRPERPVLLAVDQQLGEGAALRVAPELADPVGSLEVGEHQDVEQLGAGSRPEGVQALLEPALDLSGLTAGGYAAARTGSSCGAGDRTLGLDEGHPIGGCVRSNDSLRFCVMQALIAMRRTTVIRLLVTILTIPTLLALGAPTAMASPPPNDDFDQATVVSALPFTNELDTTQASQASDDPTDCFGVAGEQVCLVRLYAVARSEGSGGYVRKRVRDVHRGIHGSSWQFEHRASL